jgi:hypothetical protein
MVIVRTSHQVLANPPAVARAGDVFWMDLIL